MRWAKPAVAPPRICDARASAARADRRRACVEGDDRLRRRAATSCATSVTHYLDTELDALKVADSATDPSPTSGFQRVVQRAILHVQSSGRDEVTGANVLVALFSRARELCRLFPAAAGHEPPRCGELHQPRRRQGRGRRRAAATPEGRRGREARRRRQDKKRNRAQAVHRRPQREGQGRQGRSADRPHARGRPHGPDPVPPLEEQPALCRRSRRRQDRDRRRPRAQDRRGRRARGAEARGDLLARHGRAARRHALSRRFRGAAEGGRHRAREAARRDPVHRRDPHRDRRRRDQSAARWTRRTC